MTPAEDAKENAAPRTKRGILQIKLWIAVGIVFAIQVGMAFWLGNPPPRKMFRPPPIPVVQMAPDGSEDLLAIQDPTLFLLPHRDNFSGDVWLKIAPRTFSPTNWTEAARPLELSRDQLGAAFAVFMRTNLPPRFQPRIESGLDADSVSAPLAPITNSSRMFVEGDLAKLRLLTPLRLPPQTSPDILTNTVVQMVVDAQGYPFSSVILAGSGSADADSMALTNYARRIRFSPPEAEALRTVPANRMVSGKLIFEWQTVPPAPTNAPSSTP